MSFAIDLPPSMAERAVAYAQRRGTTVANLFGEYLSGLDIREDDTGANFFRLVDQADVHMPAGWKFNREECYA